ncbi:hypothetical protein SDC9_46808 [bioreactor metagenome]|uniref:Uncharacterized protein n=1 Tax=bioreactor metagenome TaxID=1076179 RepID=A0A644WAS8_9ZZZZ
MRRGCSDSEAVIKKDELLEAAGKTYGIAQQTAGVSNFDEWCELVLTITDAYQLQKIQATSSPELAGSAVRDLSKRLKGGRFNRMSMNAQHLTYGIITYDREKAEKKLNEIVKEVVSAGDEVVRIVRSKTDLFVTFKSGKCIKWVNPSWNCRGYRLHGAHAARDRQN